MTKISGPSIEQIAGQQFESPNGPAPDGPGELYTVVSGDSLSMIAQREYGDMGLWTEIAQANPQLKDPDRIWPGDQLRLPQLERKPAMSNQQVHARTGQAETGQVAANFARDQSASAQALPKKSGVLDFMNQSKRLEQEVESEMGRITGQQKARPPMQEELQDREAFRSYLDDQFQQLKKPGVDFDQLKRPPTEQVKRPPTEQVKRPPTEQIKRPPTEQIKRPPTEQVKRPPIQQGPPQENTRPPERPPVEERPPEVSRPPVEERPPEVSRPPVEERPPNIGRPPAEERPPNIGRPPAEERPPNVGRPPAEERPPHIGRPPAEERPPHIGRPPAEERPPHVGRPPAEERPPHVGRPPGEVDMSKDPEDVIRELNEIVKTLGALLRGWNVVDTPGSPESGSSKYPGTADPWGGDYGINPGPGSYGVDPLEEALTNYFIHAAENDPESLDVILRLMVEDGGAVDDPGKYDYGLDEYPGDADLWPGGYSVDPWSGIAIPPGWDSDTTPWYETPDPAPIYVPGAGSVGRPVHVPSDDGDVSAPIGWPNFPIDDPVGENPWSRPVGTPDRPIGRPNNPIYGNPNRPVNPGRVGRPSTPIFDIPVGRPDRPVGNGNVGRPNNPIFGNRGGSVGRPNNSVGRPNNPIYGNRGGNVGRPNGRVGRPSGRVGRPVGRGNWRGDD